MSELCRFQVAAGSYNHVLYGYDCAISRADDATALLVRSVVAWKERGRRGGEGKAERKRGEKILISARAPSLPLSSLSLPPSLLPLSLSLSTLSLSERRRPR